MNGVMFVTYHLIVNRAAACCAELQCWAVDYFREGYFSVLYLFLLLIYSTAKLRGNSRF